MFRIVCWTHSLETGLAWRIWEMLAPPFPMIDPTVVVGTEMCNDDVGPLMTLAPPPPGRLHGTPESGSASDTER